MLWIAADQVSKKRIRAPRIEIFSLDSIWCPKNFWHVHWLLESSDCFQVYKRSGVRLLDPAVYSNTWINLCFLVCFLVLITKRQVCCVMPSHIIIQSWVFLLGHRWTPDANEDGITNSYNIFQTASPARWERRDVEGMLGEAEGRRGSRCCNLSCCTDSSALPLYKLPHQWLKLTLILAGNFSISNAN